MNIIYITFITFFVSYKYHITITSVFCHYTRSQSYLFSADLLAVTSSSVSHSVSQLVHKNSPFFGGPSFHCKGLKFGMEVKCVYVCVCVRERMCVGFIPIG